MAACFNPESSWTPLGGGEGELALKELHSLLSATAGADHGTMFDNWCTRFFSSNSHFLLQTFFLGAVLVCKLLHDALLGSTRPYYSLLASQDRAGCATITTRI